MSACKNHSKFQNTALLLADIQVWINFLRTDMTRKETVLPTSLLTEKTVHGGGAGSDGLRKTYRQI